MREGLGLAPPLVGLLYARFESLRFAPSELAGLLELHLSLLGALHRIPNPFRSLPLGLLRELLHLGRALFGLLRHLLRLLGSLLGDMDTTLSDEHQRLGSLQLLGRLVSVTLPLHHELLGLQLRCFSLTLCRLRQPFPLLRRLAPRLGGLGTCRVLLCARIGLPCMRLRLGNSRLQLPAVIVRRAPRKLGGLPLLGCRCSRRLGRRVRALRLLCKRRELLSECGCFRGARLALRVRASLGGLEFGARLVERHAQRPRSFARLARFLRGALGKGSTFLFEVAPRLLEHAPLSCPRALRLGVRLRLAADRLDLVACGREFLVGHASRLLRLHLRRRKLGLLRLRI